MLFPAIGDGTSAEAGPGGQRGRQGPFGLPWVKRGRGGQRNEENSAGDESRGQVVWTGSEVDDLACRRSPASVGRNGTLCRWSVQGTGSSRMAFWGSLDAFCRLVDWARHDEDAVVSGSNIVDGTSTLPEVLFLGEVARILRTSRSTIERRRRAGTFPIPELPSIDGRPRWSRAAVERYLASTSGGLKPRRGRPRTRAH